MKRTLLDDVQTDVSQSTKRRRGTRRTNLSASAGVKKVWYNTANAMEPFDEHVPLFTPLTVIVWIRSALKKRGVNNLQEWVTLGEILPRHCFVGFRNVTPKTRPIKFAWEHIMAMTCSEPPLLNARKPPLSEKGKYKGSCDPDGLPLTKYAFQLTQYTVEHYLHSANEYQKLKKIPLEFRDQKDWDKSMSSDEVSEEDYPNDETSSLNEALNNNERDTKLRKSGQLKSTHRQLKEVYSRGDIEDNIEDIQNITNVETSENDRQKQLPNVKNITYYIPRKTDKKNKIITDSDESSNLHNEEANGSETESGVVNPKLDDMISETITTNDSVEGASVKDVDVVDNFQKAQSALISAYENKIAEIRTLREKVLTLQKLLSEAKIKQQELLQEITTTQQRYKTLQLKYDELQNQSQEKIHVLTKENESLRIQLWSIQTETQTQTQTTKTSPTKDTQENLRNIDIPDQDMIIKIEPNSDMTSESRGLMIDFFEPTTDSSSTLLNKNVVRSQVEVKMDKIAVNDDEVMFLSNC